MYDPLELIHSLTLVVMDRIKRRILCIGRACHSRTAIASICVCCLKGVMGLPMWWFVAPCGKGGSVPFTGHCGDMSNHTILKLCMLIANKIVFPTVYSNLLYVWDKWDKIKNYHHLTELLLRCLDTQFYNVLNHYNKSILAQRYFVEGSKCFI